MAVDCCNIVAYYPTNKDNLISVDSRSGTDATLIGGVLHPGATQGVATISAYPSDQLYRGCHASAKVDLPWISKYDCDADKMHYIYKGAGRSSVIGDYSETSGDLGLEVYIPDGNELDTYRYLKASASSGPMSLYTDELQTDGYGLVYKGLPWSFNTMDEGTLTIERSDIESDGGSTNWGPIHLQSFNINFNPGELVVVTYSFSFTTV